MTFGANFYPTQTLWSQKKEAFMASFRFALKFLILKLSSREQYQS